jgi:hypothetical protein
MRAASDAIPYTPTTAPIAAGPRSAWRERYTGTSTDTALEPATKRKTEK